MYPSKKQISEVNFKKPSLLLLNFAKTYKIGTHVGTSLHVIYYYVHRKTINLAIVGAYIC